MIASRPRAGRLRHSRREGAVDLLFLLPILVVLVGFLFYPLVYGLVLSVHDTKGFELTGFVGLDHYARAIFGDAVFQRSLLNTILFTGVAVVLQIGLGLFLAVLVADAKRGRAFFQFAFFLPFVLAPVAVGAVWKFLYAPFFGIVPTVGAALGWDTQTVAPLAEADTALWAIMAAFLWRFAGFTMVVYLVAIRSIRRDYYEYAVLEGAGRFPQFRQITWPLLWPQTFVLVLLTTLGTLRIFDMVWVMTAGGPSHATETVATDIYSTAFRFLQVGYAQAMAMILLGRDPVVDGRRVSAARPTRRCGSRVTKLRHLRWSTVVLNVLAIVWLYPVLWTLANAVKSSADIYRAPWDMPWPPAIGNIGEAWSRGQLGVGDGELGIRHGHDGGRRARPVGLRSVFTHPARPPARAVLFLLVLAH